MRALADVAAGAAAAGERDARGYDEREGEGHRDRRRDRDRDRDRDPVRFRWAVTPRAAAVAGLAVALLAGGVALRASTAPRTDAVEVLRPTASSTSPDAVGTPTAPAAPGAGTAVVHVVGAVGAPGLVTLPADARVADAVAAAGGGTDGADLAALNLARVVVDGEQLHVPRQGEAPAPAGAEGVAPPAAPSADARVDLNTADAAALDALPGVGPVLAQRILERRARGPFTSVDELDDVSGIGPAVLERLRPLVRV
ncbi:ComEA family DNA-binding protein [Cellulomonas sp. JZ18]|uniref:ComEA family DNA-binding protein n=1 Tax=Cellulomonas sp. JZ18 TaxID=2654191 RepID=UPI0012D3884F|nr:helix-hairpin-helix domain-containing protein [Cellulomonas sp. JZ18]QGQ19001.1 ComEA family DNA-binding protein [Cellulomonas sp. JZ18]